MLRCMRSLWLWFGMLNSIESFRHYVAQDVHFLKAFAQAYEMAEDYVDDDDARVSISELRKACTVRFFLFELRCSDGEQRCSVEGIRCVGGCSETNIRARNAGSTMLQFPFPGFIGENDKKLDSPVLKFHFAEFPFRVPSASDDEKLGVQSRTQVYGEKRNMTAIIGISDTPCLKEDDPEAWHVQIFRSIHSNSVKGFPKDPMEATNKNLIDMSIHTAYVKAIRSAEHFIYIENQYFIGSSFNWSAHEDLGTKLKYFVVTLQTHEIQAEVANLCHEVKEYAKQFPTIGFEKESMK
ncbi:hypothetical protein Droror1_Dr00008012 [Drosera rotundifolia]